MRILLDTNVVLDVLLKREPWVSEASAIWQANDDGRLVGHLMASALTDIFLRRAADSPTGKPPAPLSKPAWKPSNFAPWIAMRWSWRISILALISKTTSRWSVPKLRSSMQLLRAIRMTSRRPRSPC